MEKLKKIEKMLVGSFGFVFVDIFYRIGRAFFRFGKFAPVVFGRVDETNVG